MSDETNTAEEAPVVEAAPRKRSRSASAAVEQPDHKVYVSTEKHSIPFDIMIKGVVLSGAWSAKDGFVEFSVPAELVEGFEKHYHFTAGNLVAAE